MTSQILQEAITISHRYQFSTNNKLPPRSVLDNNIFSFLETNVNNADFQEAKMIPFNIYIYLRCMSIMVTLYISSVVCGFVSACLYTENENQQKIRHLHNDILVATYIMFKLAVLIYKYQQTLFAFIRPIISMNYYLNERFN